MTDQLRAAAITSVVAGSLCFVAFLATYLAAHEWVCTYGAIKNRFPSSLN